MARFWVTSPTGHFVDGEWVEFSQIDENLTIVYGHIAEYRQYNWDSDPCDLHIAGEFNCQTVFVYNVHGRLSHLVSGKQP